MVGNFDGLSGYGDLQMTSRVTSDPKFELTGLNDLNYHTFMAFTCFLEMIKKKERLRLLSIDMLGAMALARKKSLVLHLDLLFQWPGVEEIFFYNLIVSHLCKLILHTIGLKLAQPGHGPLFFCYNHESKPRYSKEVPSLAGAAVAVCRYGSSGWPPRRAASAIWGSTRETRRPRPAETTVIHSVHPICLRLYSRIDRPTRRPRPVQLHLSRFPTLFGYPSHQRGSLG